MNEWGLILDESFVELGNAATITNFQIRCGLVLEERTLLSNPPLIIAGPFTFRKSNKPSLNDPILLGF